MRQSTQPLRVGIITDGLEEHVRDGAAVIANGGVGVYIYNLVQQLRALNSAHEYHLIRYGRGCLDIYSPGHQTIILPRSPVTRLARAIDVPYGRIATRLQLDLLHYP